MCLLYAFMSRYVVTWFHFASLQTLHYPCAALHYTCALSIECGVAMYAPRQVSQRRCVPRWAALTRSHMPCRGTWLCMRAGARASLMQQEVLARARARSARAAPRDFSRTQQCGTQPLRIPPPGRGPADTARAPNASGLARASVRVKCAAGASARGRCVCTGGPTRPRAGPLLPLGSLVAAGLTAAAPSPQLAGERTGRP